MPQAGGGLGGGNEPGAGTQHAPGSPRYATRGNSTIAVAGGVTGDRGKTRPLQRLMRDSRLKAAERPLQARFSFGKRILLITLAFSILLLSGDRNWEKPNRKPLPERTVAVRYIPLPRDEGGEGELKLSGLWRVEAEDPRLGGVSGLVATSDHLLAVTDSGSVIRLPRPGHGRVATIRDLPTGPGSPYWKKYRDAESLAPDPEGRGWWVGFEFQHSLYLYDRDLSRALHRTVFPETRWKPNKGIEALVSVMDGLLLIPETGREVLWRHEGRLTTDPLPGADGAPADAVRLPDGRVLVLLRAVRPWGLTNRIALLRRQGASYALQSLGTLPLSAFDNVEGIAADARTDGGIRLWLMTDNDFSERRPTLLMTVDLPPSPDTRKPPPDAGSGSNR